MKPVLPGQFPYKRGISQQGYRDTPCECIPVAGFGDLKQANQEIRMLAAEGASGAWIRSDLHTGTAADLAQLLQGIDLKTFKIFFTAVDSAAPVAALWTVAARQLGYDPAGLPGGISNDVLGSVIFGEPHQPDLESCFDLISWAVEELPLWRPLIPGAVTREYEIGAAFELAAVMSCVQQYCRERRFKNAFLSDFLLVFTSGTRILDDIAKLRAARILSATVMREKASMPDVHARIHAWTPESMLATRQTDVNLIRVALGALAAMMGGAQAIAATPSTLPPDTFSERTALRTLQVLGHETGIALTADPCGGSDLIERRTNEISAEAFSLMDHDVKWMRAEYRRRVEEDRKKVARGDRVLVGVNRFTADDGEPRHSGSPMPVKAPAMTHAMESSLAKIETVARDGINIMPALVSAANAGATLAAMAGAIRRGRLHEHL